MGVIFGPTVRHWEWAAASAAFAANVASGLYLDCRLDCVYLIFLCSFFYRLFVISFSWMNGWKKETLLSIFILVNNIKYNATFSLILALNQFSHNSFTYQAADLLQQQASNEPTNNIRVHILHLIVVERKNLRADCCNNSIHFI